MRFHLPQFYRIMSVAERRSSDHFYFLNTERKTFFFFLNAISRYFQNQSPLEIIHMGHIFKFRPKCFISVDWNHDSVILLACWLAFDFTSRQYSDVDAIVSLWYYWKGNWYMWTSSCLSLSLVLAQLSLRLNSKL